MSVVTNVIFHMDIYPDDSEEFQQKFQEVNAFFANDQRGFVYVDDEALPRGWYGGRKILEATLLIGAFNYLDLDALIKHIQSISWEDPEKIQLIVKEQEDIKFRIIDVFGPGKEQEKP